MTRAALFAAQKRAARNSSGVNSARGEGREEEMKERETGNAGGVRWPVAFAEGKDSEYANEFLYEKNGIFQSANRTNTSGALSRFRGALL